MKVFKAGICNTHIERVKGYMGFERILGYKACNNKGNDLSLGSRNEENKIQSRLRNTVFLEKIR